MWNEFSYLFTRMNTFTVIVNNIVHYMQGNYFLYAAGQGKIGGMQLLLAGK